VFTKNPAQDPLNKQINTPESEDGFSPPSLDELARIAQTGGMEAVVAAEGVKTISDAVNKVVLLYSFARKANVHEFIQEYTKRSISTFIDIMGSADFRIEKVEEQKTRLVKKRISLNVLKQLQIEAASLFPGPGSFVAGRFATAAAVGTTPTPTQTKYVKQSYTEETFKVSSGIEGFHSRAFSDQDNLFGLADSKTRKILGLTTKDQKLLAKMDTRKEKREAVRAYLTELLDSQGTAG
jgi:hypothetical protein